MKEPLQNASSIPKKVWLHLRRLMRNSQGNGRIEKGVKGMLPLGCLPLWGSEGVTLMFSRKNSSPKPKNQMNFSIQTVSKITPFFCPAFLNCPHSEKPLSAWKPYTGLIQARDGGKNSRNPLFFPLRNFQSGITNEYGNIREKRVDVMTLKPGQHLLSWSSFFRHARQAC